MDKAVLIEGPQKESTSSGRVSVVLVRSLVVLSLVFVLFLAFGAWYVTIIQQACYQSRDNLKHLKAYTAEYDVNVRHNKGVHREHVLVDDVSQTEVVIVRAPETQHISHVLLSDFEQRLDVIFNSETDQCYFAHMNDSHPNFQQDIEALKERNGDTVDGKTVAEYTVGKALAEAELIPDDLAAFCSSSNSFWLHPGRDPKPGKRNKRSWECGWDCWTSCDYTGRCRLVCGYRCRF